MNDAADTRSATRRPVRRRGAWLLAVLLLAPAILAACKDVAPGSGVEGIQKSRSLTSVSGR